MCGVAEEKTDFRLLSFSLPCPQLPRNTTTGCSFFLYFLLITPKKAQQLTNSHLHSLLAWTQASISRWELPVRAASVKLTLVGLYLSWRFVE